MHAAVAEWVARWTPNGPVSWLDVGGRDINGNIAYLFAYGSRRTCIDLIGGPGVDIVGDIRTFRVWPYDVVCCLEVLEHSDDPQSVLNACWRNVRAGGRLIVTAAGPGRAPHSGIHGNHLEPGEHYANIDPGDLEQWISELPDVASHAIEVRDEDVRAAADREA